jgi:8-oxo-dGTP diphosphatase
VALVDRWTGRTACALQDALRLSNEAFATHLGIATRTVAKWHEKPDLTPRTEVQQLLDTALEQAPPAARSRFATLTTSHQTQPLTTGQPDTGQPLTVAIAVVTRETDVLIVHRRDDSGSGGITWQFPAGIVKPGIPPETTAVRETYAETGIHCAVLRSLGRRLHPITNVHCEYLLCEYLGGEAANKDIAENVSVTWTPINRLTRFIPADRIYPPVLQALEAIQ